ncbi:MAG: mismatch endonuclease Vsr protein [Parcubacteria group bacterium GW2011_GWE2_38_18]|nr:MAG: mismatch endonuclease Vsr protein [Parcubacteria group bacterium GW2011_GWE2_38_18]
MADIFTKEKRSEIMSKIRGKNTKVELAVFRELRRRGVYFQRYYKSPAGSPDIALPRKKIAVFIDGDFWHGYRFAERRDKLPEKYWVGKIESNMRRDRRNRSKLRKLGWKVMRVWEHDVHRNFYKTIDKIIFFIRGE